MRVGPTQLVTGTGLSQRTHRIAWFWLHGRFEKLVADFSDWEPAEPFRPPAVTPPLLAPLHDK